MLTARRTALIPLLAIAVMLLTAGAATGAPPAQTTTSGFVQVNIPNLAGQTPWFAENKDEGALVAPSANDLWLVGGFFHHTGPRAGDYYFSPLVDHWNGETWTLQRIPEPKAATSFSAGDVSARGSDDVWISAGGTANGKPFSYLLRWNGSSWRKLAVPRDVAYISDLAVGGPKDVWIIGGAGDACLSNTNSATTRMLHWNGEGWHSYWSENECRDFPDEFEASSIFASAPGTAWWLGAFDGHENLTPEMRAYCFGSSCPASGPTLPCGGGYDWGEFSGAAGTASDMWVVGWRIPADDLGESQGQEGPLVCHYANGTWTDSSPEARYEFQSFNSATLLPDGELWAVGQRNPAGTSIMRRGTDGTWTDMGGINFEAGGVREAATLSQVVHMPGTATQMWATGFRDPLPGKQGRAGGFLLYHP